MKELARVSAALDVLVDALARCREEDVRNAKVFIALEFLEPYLTEKWPIEQFRRALEDSNEEGRWQNLNASLNGIKLSVNSGIR
ncbi:MAG: hypothetical protein E6J74_08750 [Deltaproteobacteria bacterium]|nr:MAG: hypothetical protein E6J74_08750 [Deltaproteobacteria bacterium]